MPKDIVSYIHVATHPIIRQISQMQKFVVSAEQLATGSQEIHCQIQETRDRLPQVRNDEYEAGLIEDYQLFIKELEEHLKSAESEVASHIQRVEEVNLKVAAYNIALQALATSLLQIAKQLISTHFLGAKNCPDGRMVGGQPLKTVIWEGRNHAVHYEEGTPRKGVMNCFDQLKADFGPQFDVSNTPPKNLSPLVVDLLKWSDIHQFETDMRSLLNSPPS